MFGSCLQVRRVLDVIRGRTYEEALVLLEYMPYKACERIIKVLMSVSMDCSDATAHWVHLRSELACSVQSPLWTVAGVSVSGTGSDSHQSRLPWCNTQRYKSVPALDQSTRPHEHP